METKGAGRGAVLNRSQDEAASALDGPVLVIAGAGTGKTSTLVHRLVRLVESGVPAQSILLLTFTRRAALEMTERASRLLRGGAIGRLAGGTFHSFANLILRRYGGLAGVPSDYTVLDQADTHEILGGIRSELKLSARARGFPQRGTIAAILSKATNKEVEIEQIVEDEYPQFLHETATLTEIGGSYEKYKLERRLLDFDDLLVGLRRLLQDSQQARTRIAKRYQYVMVDEYQDTNTLQAQITRLLAGEKRNVMVVGDDAQSIYAFRGARHRNLFDFHEEFADARLITLEQNYRSTQPVLNVANALMTQMSSSFRKRLFTERVSGAKPLLVEAMDEEEQAKFVTEKVNELHRAGTRLSEMAVLFRAGSRSFALELELESRRVPFVKYGGFRFLESAHIKDVLAHLRVLANPFDDLSLARMLMLLHGVGRVGARKIQQAVAGESLARGLKAYPARGKTREGLARLAKLLGELECSGASPASRLQLVVEYYRPILEKRFDDWPRRQRDLEQLVALCGRYRTLEALLTELAIDPPTTASRRQLATPGGEDKLVLSTMHSAKGLEWRVVFVIQAIDGCIPMVHGSDDDDDKLDEELRLMYVAVTRAKDELFLVHPRETARGYGFGWAGVSRFIEAVPDGLVIRRQASELLAPR